MNRSIAWYGIAIFLLGVWSVLPAHAGQVREYWIAAENEVDLHTAHWHGATVLDGPALPKNWNRGKRLDTVPLLPASTKSVTLEALRTGTWLFHCHVHDHMKAGMITHWQVVE